MFVDDVFRLRWWCLVLLLLFLVDHCSMILWCVLMTPFVVNIMFETVFGSVFFMYFLFFVHMSWWWVLKISFADLLINAFDDAVWWCFQLCLWKGLVMCLIRLLMIVGDLVWWCFLIGFLQTFDVAVDYDTYIYILCLCLFMIVYADFVWWWCVLDVLACCCSLCAWLCVWCCLIMIVDKLLAKVLNIFKFVWWRAWWCVLSGCQRCFWAMFYDMFLMRVWRHLLVVWLTRLLMTCLMRLFDDVCLIMFCSDVAWSCVWLCVMMRSMVLADYVCWWCV